VPSGEAQVNPKRDEIFNALRKHLRESIDSSSVRPKSLFDLANNPVCSVIFDADVHCVSVIWKGPATSGQIRYIHEGILDIVVENGVNAVLADNAELLGIGEDDQNWVRENWMPRALAAGLRFGARNNPRLPAAKKGVEALRATMPPQFQGRTFEDLNDGRAWLKTVTLNSGATG
jgi:hypothetical protein